MRSPNLLKIIKHTTNVSIDVLTDLSNYGILFSQNVRLKTKSNLHTSRVYINDIEIDTAK